MDKELLRKVQLVQLDIAKEIKRICDDNNIKYWLDSGTLLGAIRHKGFIPWDDDLDIGMLRKDYEKFLQIAPEKLDKQYFLQTPYSDKSYGMFFAKVRKLGTRYVEGSAKKSKAHNEVWVDVFPYDSCPDDILIRKKVINKTIFYGRLLFMKTRIQPWLTKKGLKKSICILGYIPYKICALFWDREKLLKKATYLQTKFNEEKTSFLYPHDVACCGKWFIPSTVFDSLESTLFEDTVFTIPSGYDEYLKSVYGDYMKLPPEDKRENQHNIVEVKL